MTHKSTRDGCYAVPRAETELQVVNHWPALPHLPQKGEYLRGCVPQRVLFQEVLFHTPFGRVTGRFGTSACSLKIGHGTRLRN